MHEQLQGSAVTLDMVCSIFVPALSIVVVSPVNVISETLNTVIAATVAVPVDNLVAVVSSFVAVTVPTRPVT